MFTHSAEDGMLEEDTYFVSRAITIFRVPSRRNEERKYIWRSLGGAEDLKMHVFKVSPADLGRYLDFVSRFSEAAARARAQYHIFTSLPRI